VYCAECGTANPIGAETCEVCGSPLGPSSGDLSCHVCGAPMEEHDRFCRACGQSQSGSEAGRFEPGPSFVDDSALEVNTADLPPWLREMTESATNNGNGHVAAAAPAAEQADNLPPWLDSAPQVNGANHKNPTFTEPAWSGPSQQQEDSAAAFSLISEDDLPEWLRALGDQEFEPESQPAQSAPTMQAKPTSHAPAATITPTVSRAWLSRSREVESQSTEEIAADFTPLESGPTASLKRTPAPQTDELTLPKTEEPVVAEPQQPSTASEKSNPVRVRLIVFSVVVLLVVILGFFAVSNLL
jgi:RNA polymerase subunit RPABC4/transcription elongation factor Spt4